MASKQDSITATKSFEARLLEAERWRLALMAMCMLLFAGVWELRRTFNDKVASEESVFYPIITILAVGFVVYAIGFADASRRISRQVGFPKWRAYASVVVDLGVPFGCLLVAQLHSPRGAYAALSGPTLLLAPIVIMLSVLRLKPASSLLIGAIAAGAHWALAIRASSLDHLSLELRPVVYSYGAMLLLTGIGAAVLARFIRTYIEDAVREATAAEQVTRQLASVEHELGIAHDIQLSLLPTEPPRLAGFDIAGMARPASHAGGDYYDWQQMPDGRLVVAIADVTGHGIGPALVMAVCRAYARAMVPTASNASDLLHRLNDLIIGDIKGERFITMAVAIISPGGDVELLSAGHGPTFLYRGATKSAERFGGNGLPLGVADGEHFDPTARFRLEPGDSLIFLTDGFLEQPGPNGKIFGIDRLTHAVESNADGAASQTLIESIDRAVKAYAQGTPQGDDTTAVVIRRT